MNILYLTFLDGKPWVGPSYSIPNQIRAQAKYDNVYWYNLCPYEIDEGKKNLSKWRSLDYYSDLKDFATGKIENLPAPFNHPDLIVVEQCYPFVRNGSMKDVLKLKTPYIIVPRGEFTGAAQRKKAIKKMIGNCLFRVHGFAKKAVAIQFLTDNENAETNKSWGKKRIVVPNGVEKKNLIPNSGDKDGLFFTYIGRYEPYQKGLDLLVDALLMAKEELMSKNVSVHFYGSDFENKRTELENYCREKGLSDVVTFHDAVFDEDKKTMLQGSSLFLTTSRFEGHPTGLLEALSYGLPCLVTTGSNMRKEIEESDAGWGADNDSASIAKALLKALNELDNFPRKKRNALKLADLYSWDTIAKNSHDIYCKLVMESNRKKTYK